MTSLTAPPTITLALTLTLTLALTLLCPLSGAHLRSSMMASPSTGTGSRK